MNTKSIINVFISSKNRDTNSTPYNFNCYFPDNLIVCNPNQGIKMNIISFDIVNSMYNINIHNNTFDIIETDLDGDNAIVHTFTITEGNYNVLDLQNYINANNLLIELSYDNIQNKFIYTTNNNLKFIFIDVKKAGAYLGFDNNDYIQINNNMKSYNKLNIVYSNKVILRATNLAFELASLENINNTNNVFEISNIILWLSKNDIAPFQVINYNNYDGGNSYNYNIYNKFINHINFQITNEYDEIIEDCPDWTMSVQFTIYDKHNDELIRLFNICNSYLRGIYVLLNIFYDYIVKF